MYEEVDKALKFAEKLGIEDLEIWIEHDKIKELSWREDTEIADATHFTGVGVRAIIGKKQGIFSFTGFSEKLLKRGVKIAYKIARISRQDPFFSGLPEKYEKNDVKNIRDKRIEEMCFEEMKDVKECITDLARAEFPKGSLKAVSSQVFLFSLTDEIHEITTKIFAGLRMKYGEHTFKKSFSSRTLEKFRESFAIFSKRADTLKNFRNPKIIESGKIDIVLMPEVAGAVFRKMLAEQLCADLVQKGKSTFHETEIDIAGEGFTLTDSGVVEHAVASRSFDGDGLKTKETVLIENGVLKSFLHNYYTACIEGTETTGNSYRKYNSLPSVAPNNLILKEGDTDIEELDNCLLVYKIIGSKLSNPAQGIISFHIASGFIKKNSELIPVSGVMVYEDFFDIMKNRMEICKGAEWHGNLCFPPVLMKNVNVVGR